MKLKEDINKSVSVALTLYGEDEEDSGSLKVIGISTYLEVKIFKLALFIVIFGLSKDEG